MKQPNERQDSQEIETETENLLVHLVLEESAQQVAVDRTSNL
jgi:hypothetical protein